MLHPRCSETDGSVSVTIFFWVFVANLEGDADDDDDDDDDDNDDEWLLLQIYTVNIR